MKNTLLACCLALALPWPAQALDLEVGVAREGLTDGLADWKSTYLEAEQKLGERRAVYGALRSTERFGLDDRDWLAGLYQPLDERWTINGELGGSATHRVLPERTAALNLHRILEDGWGVAGGGRHTVYPDAQTNAVSFTAERYLGAYRAAYTFTSTHLGGASTSPSHRVQLNHYYGERSTVGLSASRGKEAENVPPAGVRTAAVSALALIGRHALDRDWAVSYEAFTHRQDSFYTRRGLRLGLRRSF